MDVQRQRRRKIKNTVVKIPILGKLILILYRFKSRIGHITVPFRQLIRWLFESNEVTNLTFNLVERNKLYLASTIAYLTHKPYEEVLGYINELDNDTGLKAHITQSIQESDERHFSDLNVRFGRRLGWYAFVRTLKPRVVVETGVDRGLGSCVLTAALLKNAEEDGSEGYYYGTEINPEAGYLLSGKYAKYGEVLYGDSIESLRKLECEIDLFINDSDHSASYELREYETIQDKISDRAILLGDNSHYLDTLFQFSLKNNRRFLFFKEETTSHWYGGGGIGISFKDDYVRAIPR